MSAPGRSVVTVGTYDGVHLGHQRLVSETMREAARLGVRGVVVTFDRHPTMTLHPEHAPRLITGLDHKLELIEATGIDEVVVLDFDRERANEAPEEFVTELLVTDLEAVSVLVGSNFRFGHDQLGDVALLESLGRKLGFSARGIDLVTDDESKTVVSSRRIRQLIAEGSLSEAGRLLGRPFELRGALRGMEIDVSEELCRPPVGEYAVSIGRLSGTDAGSDAVDAVVEIGGAGEVVVQGDAGASLDGDLVAVAFRSDGRST